jgi:two-component system nitrogen regulation response regulator GlnG/two-component system response regulator HydG
LVVAWYPHEPGRIGESALIAQPSGLGRGAGSGALRRVEFMRQGPGAPRPTGSLAAPNISRDQLEMTPTDDGLLVRNVGKCALMHNGRRVDEVEAFSGDSLTLEDTIVLLVEQRNVLWPQFDACQFEARFGEADACQITGESEAVWQLRQELLSAARSNAHVLVHGPSGAGKELAARAIHQLSERRRGPLVSRNAATFPESLIDAELFGCEKNYPNVGVPARPGLIAEASGGTLLLDEVGELPEVQQTHLLRVLDNGGEYQALGDARPRRSDLRVVGMTNRSLGDLRADFLARFAVRVEVPDLSQRLSDLPLLMRRLWRRLADEQPTLPRQFLAISQPNADWEPLIEPRVIELLLRHEYVHNARELERLMRVAVSSSAGQFVAATSSFQSQLRFCETSPEGEERELSKEEIATALEAGGGSPTRAAAALGLRNRHVLYRLMKKHGL